MDEAVSVAGGACVDIVSVCGGRGRRRGCGWGGEDDPTVSVAVGAEDDALVICGMVDVAAPRGAVVVGGSVPATVFGAALPCVPSGAGLSSSVKFVVVSTPVFVIGGVVSPGALMVDVTPLACPS